MKEANISPEQAEKMTEMRERLWKVDGELRVVCVQSEKRDKWGERREGGINTHVA